jgi:hypothetical protein
MLGAMPSLTARILASNRIGLGGLLLAACAVAGAQADALPPEPSGMRMEM